MIQAAIVLAIIALTMQPSNEPGWVPLTCVFCGSRGLADFIANMLLFAPLGFILAWTGRRVGEATAIGAILSITIEVAQLFIPGRYSTLGDVLSNTLGAAAGAALLVGLLSLRGAPPASRRAFAMAAGALAGLSVVVTAILVRPAFPSSTYWGQWMPYLGGMSQYRGTVTSVTLRGATLPDHRMGRSALVRDELRNGSPITVTGQYGPTSGGAAPLFAIADDASRFVFMLASQDDDLFIRYYTRAEALELTPVRVRFHHAMAAVRHGDTVTIRAWRLPGRWCIEVRSVATCRGVSGAGLWRILAPGWMPVPLLFDIIWMALMFVPVGYWGRGGALAAALALGLVPLVLLPAARTGIVFSVIPLAAAAAGAGVGRLVSVAFTRHSLTAGTRHA